MPKITIDIPKDVSCTLKMLAIKNGRSLSQFIPRYLTQCVKNSITTFDEAGEFIISQIPNQSNQLQALQQSNQPLTLEQLQAQGVTNLKLTATSTSAHTPTTLTPEQEQIVALKQQNQLNELKQKRAKFIKKTIEDVFKEADLDPELLTLTPGIIDTLYEKTDEEIYAWVKKQKEEIEYEIAEDSLYLYQTEIEEIEKHLILPLDKNETYRQIKNYAVNHDLTGRLYELIEYPNFNYDNISETTENTLLKPALDTPLDYQYSKEELEELNKILSWRE